jgi:hypothetical protein
MNRLLKILCSESLAQSKSVDLMSFDEDETFDPRSLVEHESIASKSLPLY